MKKGASLNVLSPFPCVAPWEKEFANSHMFYVHFQLYRGLSACNCKGTNKNQVKGDKKRRICAHF